MHADLAASEHLQVLFVYVPIAMASLFSDIKAANTHDDKYFGEKTYLNSQTKNRAVDVKGVTSEWY